MTQYFYVLTLLSCSVYIYIICHNIGVFAWFVNSWPTNKLTRRFFIFLKFQCPCIKDLQYILVCFVLKWWNYFKNCRWFPQKKRKTHQTAFLKLYSNLPSSWPMQYMSWCNEGFSIKQCQNSQRWFSALLQSPPPPPPPISQRTERVLAVLT